MRDPAPRLLALDLATVSGWACGSPAESPRALKFGTFKIFGAGFGPGGDGLGLYLKAFRDQLALLVHEHRPTVLVFESPTIRMGKSSLITVRKLTGLTGMTEYLAYAEFGLPVFEAAVPEIAKFLLGASRFPGGRKEKKTKTIETVRALGYDIRGADEADAVALYLFACAKIRLPVAA